MKRSCLYRVVYASLLASVLAMPVAFADDDLEFRGTSLEGEDASNPKITPAAGTSTVVEKSSDEMPFFLLRKKNARQVENKVHAVKTKTVAAKPVIRKPTVAVVKREPKQIAVAPSLVVAKSDVDGLRKVLAPQERQILVEPVGPVVGGAANASDLYTASLSATEPKQDIYTSALKAVEPPADLYTGSLPTAREPDEDLYTVQLPDTHSQVASIGEAAKVARENSPLVKAFEADAKAAEAGVDREIASFAPTVTGALGAGYRNDEDGINKDNYGELSFQLPIYTGGQRRGRLQSARAQSEAAASNVTAAEDRVTGEVALAYVQYVSSHQMVQILRETEDGIRRVLETVDQQRKAGFASGPDVQQIKVELRALNQQITDAETMLAKSRERVTQMAGRPVSPNIDQYALERGLAPGRDALLLKAMAENPRVTSAVKGYESLRSTYQSRFGRSLPQLSLAGNYRYDLDNNYSRSGRDAWNMGARLSVPLLDLATQADTNQARFQAEAAYYRAQEQRRLVADEFSQLWSDYVGGIKEKQATEAKIAEYRKLVQSARARFEEGDGSLSDYLNAQGNVKRVQIELMQINARHLSIVTQLLVTSGTFDTAVFGR